MIHFPKVGLWIGISFVWARSPQNRLDRTISHISAVLAELADLIARGELEVPIAGVFALDDVREAYRQLELRHTRGKLVLRP